MSLTRTYEFAASHRLHSPHLSDEENVRAYGKCNHVHGHGHNYVLEVTVSGEPDPASGMLVDLDHLDAVVEREVVDRYDHRNLDVDVEELRGRVTTSENVAKAIFDRLDASLGRSLSRVRLLETARNAFEVRR
ncbi:MAG: 6-carboxytetrahydropterin synthase [Nitrospirae bacterium]|nr:6-carboxytetrahydropterin synthase [Fimbriimonadaceae bacterium]